MARVLFLCLHYNGLVLSLYTPLGRRMCTSLRSDPLIIGNQVYLKNLINGSRLKAYIEGKVVN